MRLGDIMSEDVETIAGDTPLGDAAELMRRQDIRHLLVTDRGSVIGVLSQRNLVRRGGRNGKSKVREAMSTPVVYRRPTNQRPRSGEPPARPPHRLSTHRRERTSGRNDHRLRSSRSHR